jgi:polyketide cyclase/dehydrase/lipid transport protein
MKYLAIGLISAAVVFLLVSAFLPNEYEIERELVIPTEIEMLYDSVADLTSWPAWSAWNRELDPEATWLFEGEAGVGSVMQWDGLELGKGRLEIVEAVSPSQLTYVLTMPDGSLASRGTLALTAEGSATRVRWTQSGGLPGLRMRWVGLFFDDWLGTQFETSLQGLKDRHVDEV